MLTLSQARSKCVKFSAPNELDDRINLACELLLTLTNPKGSTERVAINANNGTLTLPRHLFGMVGFAPENVPRPIWNQWYEVIMSGPGVEETIYGKAIDLGDNWCVFRDISNVSEEDGCRLKLKQDVSETSVVCTLKGYDTNSELVRTTPDAGTNYIDGEQVTASVAGATTATSFLSLTQIVKPVTLGRLRLYAIHPTTAVETLIAIYEPAETNVAWRRYRVPGRTNGTGTDETYAVECLCQVRQVDATNETDALPIGNVNALICAMQSLQYRDVNDAVREQAMLEKALVILGKEAARYHPPSTFPAPVQFTRGVHAGSSARSFY